MAKPRPGGNFLAAVTIQMFDNSQVFFSHVSLFITHFGPKNPTPHLSTNNSFWSFSHQFLHRFNAMCFHSPDSRAHKNHPESTLPCLSLKNKKSIREVCVGCVCREVYFKWKQWCTLVYPRALTVTQIRKIQ